MDELEKKLDDLHFKILKTLPSEVYKPTIFEISKYPHYENVCSNILSFYLDSSQPHGLSNLLIKVLCNIIGIKNISDDYLSVESVQREFPTDESKRIDILISTKTFIIVVEVKINAKLDNPLDQYISYINNLPEFAGRDKYYVILSKTKTIKPIDIAQEQFLNSNAIDGFKRISFNDLFWNIQQLIGNYLQKADNKYLTLLIDLMTSLGQTPYQLTENEIQNVDFYIERKEKFDDVLNFHNKVYEIRKRVIEKIAQNTELMITPKIWKDYVLYFEKQVEEVSSGKKATIIIDFILEYDYYIIRFDLRSGDKSILNKIKLLEDKSKYKIENKHYIFWNEKIKFYKIKEEDIVAKLNEILPQIKISE